MTRREEQWEAHGFPLEADFQKYVLKRMREYNVDKPKEDRVLTIKVMRCNINGVSDILMLHKGKLIAVELKVKDNKPTELQEKFLEEAQWCGATVGIAYTWGEFKDILHNAGVNI